ncbi:MAG: YibE/F family protein [bacterium]
MFERFNVLQVALLLTLVFTVSLIWSHPASCKEITTVLTVQSIKSIPAPGDTGQARIVFNIQSDEIKPDTYLYTQFLWGVKSYDPKFVVGREFIGTVSLTESGKIGRVILGQNRREHLLLFLFVAVTVLLFVVGRWEGVLGLISTLFTLGLIYYFFFPLVFSGINIFAMGLLICLGSIVFTISLIMKWNTPTFPAIASLCVVTGLVFVCTIAGFEYLGLTGKTARHSRLIITQINRAGLGMGALWKILTVGIVLGSLGAMMDVGVVISSTIDEIVRDKPDYSFYDAYKSGVHVGREILSTMINTLIFAYMGIFIPLFLALKAFNVPWVRFINYEFVAIEILRVVIGLTGLCLIIPVSSAAASWWCRR